MATSTAYYNSQYAPPSRTGTFSSTMSSEANFKPPPLERNFSELSIQDIRPSDNIVNQKGGLNSSLYQKCLALRKRLAYVPGFEEWLAQMDIEEQESEDDTDPVTLMWNTLRGGEPLMTIYNALQPPQPLMINRSKISQANTGKAATFKFLQACLKDLKFPSKECFLITDLYGSDTTGFVKVLKVIDRVLDIVSARGLMLDHEEQIHTGIDPEQKGRSHRDNIIQELVSTERDYVQHLEILQQFKNQLDQCGAIAGDIIHDIFLNLNALLDFQRRFLIRIEQQNSLDGSVQNWGHLFTQYQDSFRVYEPFIANSVQCNEIVVREWEKIRAAPLSPGFQQMVEAQTVLTGFLLKPFQRLSKYPLLLDDLRKRGDYDAEKSEDLHRGSDAMKAVLDRANLAVERIKMNEEVQELVQLVDDWKGHRLENFGELVLFGSYPVLKGEGSKETEREPKLPFDMTNGKQYKIYLFQRILLCCKELNPKKEKNRLAGKSGVDKKGRPKLQLKGRIFIQNVTDMISTPKADHQLLQIWWKGDPGIETFVIKFKLVSEKEKWSATIQNLRSKLNDARAAVTAGVSQTEFTSLSGLVKDIPNPYRELEEDYDEDDIRLSQASTLNGTGTYPELSTSRTASNNSLRSRGGSGGMSLSGRVPPPRFPLPEPHMAYSGMPLKVTTNMDDPGTPDERYSHFSPTGDSPSSLRSSSQAGMYPFPRRDTPSNSGWPQDNNGNKHNTAPPMGRHPLREDENANGYGVNGRPSQRPSLPAMTAAQSAQQLELAQRRARSHSTPDVHNHSPGRRLPNGMMSGQGEEVPVPSIPPHLASMRAPINRSQNNSPTDNGRLPRSQTQSPNMMRGPQYPTNYGYDQYSQSQRSNSTHSTATITGPSGRVLSPAISSSTMQLDNSLAAVTQLKVKIHFEPKPSHVTIVVPVIIKHRSLIDRIDSKMEKVSSASIAKGTARLRYKDADGELVLIENDEDVSMAVEDWQEGNNHLLKSNIIPDFDLFWKETGSAYPKGS